MTQYTYVDANGARLFTLVLLPREQGTYPTVIYRSPYVDAEELLTEREICARRAEEFSSWTQSGYAVVFQHCRGRGKSEGECIPYIHEREDGLLLQEWVRKQPFYNGELYLCGASYTSSVHLVTAPFADDVKGAILAVQDCERYNCNYRNGFYKVGLHGDWYVHMYKRKQIREKNYSIDSYRMLPLCDFSQRVFGERVADFDEILRHPKRSDPFWDTRYGGGEAHDALKHAGIPILLVTGFYDIYTGGVFDMWRGLDEKTRAVCALVVHPFDHGGKGEGQPIVFPGGALSDAFSQYKIRWLDAIRGKCDAPFEKGKVTYYQLFENKWCCDAFYDASATCRMTLGQGAVTYRYDPADPAHFKGGLSANFGGNAWQNKPHERKDIVSVYTAPFDGDTYVKGKIGAKLTVSSDCEDTCFYVRLSLCKAQGDYGLRDDIQQISNVDAAYVPNGKIEMTFSFDEHAFLIRKGERLRVDISSSAYPFYVPHTNRRGLFSAQTDAKIANNTIFLGESHLELPIHS